MAKEIVQLDQGQLLKRLAGLEQQIAKSGQQRGGGVGTALKAFGVGALVGGGVALLYAPRPGEQTRRQLLQRGSQAKEQATQAAGQLKEQAQQAVSQGTDQVQAATMRSPSEAPAPPAPAQWQAPPRSEPDRGAVPERPAQPQR
jgi:YtxH-like protein